MTCKEKIDEIEKILNGYDKHEVKIGCIREIVEDAEDKAISIKRIKELRKEIDDRTDYYCVHSNETPYTAIQDVLERIDKMLREVEK